MKRYLHSCFLFAFLGIWLSASGLAVAQTAYVPATGTVSATNESELKSLIKTLENDAERKKLGAERLGLGWRLACQMELVKSDGSVEIQLNPKK